MITKELIEKNSVEYSKKFSFELDKDPFPWFLLSVLFGARISESIALRTFYMFRMDGILSPESIIDAGFDGLVSLLDSGGYTRYDFRTAAKLEEMSKSIIKAGGLKKIHDDSENMADLVGRLKGLAKGIGDVTVGIFMREMVGVWEKAEPYPSKLALQATEYLKLDPYGSHLKLGVKYSRFESFLVKVAKECIRRKSNSEFCTMLSKRS